MNYKTKQITATQLFDELEHIADFMPSPLYWLDKNGIVLGFNDVMGKMHGGLEDVRDKVIGKCHEDFFPEPVAKILNENNRKVIESGKPIEFEEEVVNVLSGQTMHYTSIRAPWRDDNGNIIGIIGTSIDTTDKKERERLQLEIQKNALAEKEKLITFGHKIAHDISSPLSALSMMMSACDELPEDKRTTIKRAAESILDITNNLLSTYRNEDPGTNLDIEQRQPLLISDCLVQLLSEKRAQYSNRTVQFEIKIAEEAQFAFAQMQSSQFRRCMSNLVNNAVDALYNNDDALITINLTADAQFIFVAIQDNGKGMSSETLQKILRRQSFTNGKQHGHGLGLQQVWDTLDYNQGVMTVDSSVGNGTTIQLAFPRIEAAEWIAQEIHLTRKSIIFILDDEESIHGAWKTRFAPYLRLYPTLKVRHFKLGQKTLDFLTTLSRQDKEHIVFLSDYELLREDKNGLQIIEESGIKRAILVTSYYADSQVRDQAIELNVKILPKQMASIVRIRMD